MCQHKNSLVQTIQMNGRFIQIIIADKPVCGADQKMVYGVAHGEIASINCTVKANPSSGIRFRWTFNSSAELNTLPESRYKSQGPTSQVCV